MIVIFDRNTNWFAKRKGFLGGQKTFPFLSGGRGRVRVTTARVRPPETFDKPRLRSVLSIHLSVIVSADLLFSWEVYFYLFFFCFQKQMSQLTMLG